MPKIIFLFIPAIFIVLLLAAISSKYQLTPKLPQVLPTIAPSPSLFHEPPWQTYQDQNISFVYPSTFEKEPPLSQGSGYTQEFNDNQNNLFLSFSSKGNYNQITGKAYSDIDEYVGLSYKVKEVVVGGQSGRQPLPRAGSENVFSAVFFSKDSKIIYTLELKAGDTPFNTPVEKVTEGESIFTQILSTFKFLPEPTPTINANDPYNHHLNSKTVKIGYITNTYNKDNKVFINLNYIEWLNDKTAPNGYRIIDNNKLVRTFEVSPQAQIYCLSTSHSGADNLILPDELNSILTNDGSIGCSDTSLFRIDFDSSNKVNWMRQVYTP